MILRTKISNANAKEKNSDDDDNDDDPTNVIEFSQIY